MLFAVQNRPVFGSGYLEVNGNVGNVRVETIRVLKLLIVDAHFNNGKNWKQKIDYITRQRNWNVFFLFLRFLISFNLYWFFNLLFLIFLVL